MAIHFGKICKARFVLFVIFSIRVPGICSSGHGLWRNLKKKISVKLFQKFGIVNDTVDKKCTYCINPPTPWTRFYQKLTNLYWQFPSSCGDEKVYCSILTAHYRVDLLSYCQWHGVCVQIQIILKRQFVFSYISILILWNVVKGKL